MILGVSYKHTIGLFECKTSDKAAAKYGLPTAFCISLPKSPLHWKPKYGRLSEVLDEVKHSCRSGAHMKLKEVLTYAPYLR